MTNQVLADLRQMWRMRAFEEQVRSAHGDGAIVGSVHLGIGQEAIAVGALSEIGADDAVFATYRGHNWALGCGVTPQALFAELLGRGTGINGGRGGSAYLTAPDHRFFGENSIVGAGTPHAVGAALAGRYDKTNRVALSVFGDGAMNQGAVHEAMNMAAAMSLPVVFICENNGWSEMTALSRMVGDDRLYRRAKAYGMRGERIDGNSPSAVRTVVGEVIRSARAGDGPSLIEAMTARLVGHYIGDIEHYRPAADHEAALAGDPIRQAGAQVAAAGVTGDELAELERDARTEMADAFAQALDAPLADPLTATDHVYAVAETARA